MELATRTLDFARALSELSVRGNAIVDGGTMLVQWLVREKIDDREFQYYMDILRDKAAPNTFGLHVQRSIQEADTLRGVANASWHRFRSRRLDLLAE